MSGFAFFFSSISVFILANPPFNQSDWGIDILQEDGRWKYGVPPNGNANYGWLQHMLYHLSPKGVMATVLSNGSLSSNTSGEGEIRKNMILADLVECIVALPKQLFYNTGIPACIWIMRRDKNHHNREVLFIDASEMGYMKDRVHRDLSDEDVDISDIVPLYVSSGYAENAIVTLSPILIDETSSSETSIDTVYAPSFTYVIIAPVSVSLSPAS